MRAWRPRPFSYGPWTGRSYPPWSDAQLPSLANWLAEPSPNGIALKPGVAWRCGNVVVKHFRPQPPSFWRHPASIRAAERYRRVWPVPSPRPWLALAHPDSRGILVSDFVQGESFLDVFGKHGPAMEAFPAFMALMHRHRVFHGDLNCFNMIWSHDHWVLLDLDGLRTGFHSLRPRHLIRRQWAQLYAFRDFSPAIRDLFWRYHQIMHPGQLPEPDWQAIEQRALALPDRWHRKRNPGRRRTDQRPS